MKIIDDLQRKLDSLIREPANYRLYNEIGVLLYQLQDLENAGLYLRKAYELCPHDLDILYNYAGLLYLQFRWKEAVMIYQAALEIEPDDEEVIAKLKDLHYQLGEYQEAVKYLSTTGKEIIYDRK